MTITDFLLARIAEDEAVAQAATPEWDNESDRLEWEDLSDEAFRHARTHNPARVVAECQAKRAIVAMHKPTTLEDLWGAARADLAKRLVCDYDSSPDGHIGDTAEWPCVTLRHLAAVYADHPDYQEEWRPA